MIVSRVSLLLRELRGCCVVTLFLLASEAPAAESDAGATGAASARTEIRQFVEGLGHQRFQERETAHRELLRLSEGHLDILLDECLPIYSRTDDPEVRVRLGEIFRRIFESQVLNRPRGFLGIRIAAGQTVDPNGVPVPVILVRQAVDNSPAASAGIRSGDMILGIDAFDMGQDRLLDAFLDYIQRKGPEATVKLSLKRGDQTLVMEVKLGTMPEEIRALSAGARIPVEKQFRDWLREREAERQTKAVSR